MIGSALVLLILLVRLPFAEDTHTIKIKRQATGDVVKIENQEDDDTNMFGGGKEALNLKQKTSKREIYVETVLARPEKSDKPTKLKCEFEKARFTEAGKETTFVYEGKTVVIEKKEGHKLYAFFWEDGKELPYKEARSLRRDFNQTKGLVDEKLLDAVLPSKPVKVGETWKIDPAKAFHWIDNGGSLGGEGSKASGKLLDVYEKDGHKFGKMNFELETPIPDDPDKKVKILKGSKGRIELHMDVCIDGSLRDGVIKTESLFEMQQASEKDGKEEKFTWTMKEVITKKTSEAAKK